MAKSRLRSMAVGLLALAVASGAAYSAGYFPGFPIVGGASYCSSVSGVGNTAGTGQPSITGTPGQFGQGFPNNQSGQGGNFNSVCNVTVPAGPAYTGEELVPADTQLSQGQQPQTVLIPSSLLGSINTKSNRLVGGDFAINLWQRGTTPVSAASPSTTVMGADRWAVYSSGNVVTVSKQTAAADSIPASGLYASMRVSRPSGTNTSAVCVGQVLDKVAAADLIGKNAVVSFYALAGAGLSAVANNTVNVTVAYYTAADSATPGTNTDAFMKGTVAGYTAVTAGGTAQPATTATVASGAAAVPITTTWTRYGVYAPIPTATAAGTAVTGVGVTFCYTPASGTGGSTEWFELEGVQMQGAASSATATLPNGITSATGFERRPAQLETDYQLYYSYVLTDGAATQRYAMGQSTTTTASTVVVPFPVTMRITPTTTVGTAASFATTIPAGTAQNCTTLAAVASSNTTGSGALSCTVAANMVAGSATQLIGQATGGLVTISAEP